MLLLQMLLVLELPVIEVLRLLVLLLHLLFLLLLPTVQPNVDYLLLLLLLLPMLFLARLVDFVLLLSLLQHAVPAIQTPPATPIHRRLFPNYPVLPRSHRPHCRCRKDR